MSEESFFPKYSWLDQFRGRSAYGVSGLQPGLVAARRTYQPITASINGADLQGLIGSQLGTPDIKPERVSEIETGFDARILGNRVNLEVRRTSTRHRRRDRVRAHRRLVGLAVAVPAGEHGRRQESGFETVITTQLIDNSIGWDLTVSGSHGTVRSPRLVRAARFKRLHLAGDGSAVSGLFFRPYTFSDANSDGRIQATEVTVDTAARAFGYQVPRDLVSIQNGLDLFSRRLRMTALLDYKGGHSVFDRQLGLLVLAVSVVPGRVDPSASIADQARSVAARYGTTVGGTPYTTNAGYLSNGRFWRSAKCRPRSRCRRRQQEAPSCRSVEHQLRRAQPARVDELPRCRSGIELRRPRPAERLHDGRPADVLHPPPEPPLLTQPSRTTVSCVMV